MLSKVCTYGIWGIDAHLVTIEIDVSRGLPGIVIVGLPDNSVKESKERVRSAIKNCGFQLLNKRITINLSPADLKKEGPSFDLAMAIGILIATEQIRAPHLFKVAIMGEISLDGKIRAIKGALPMALANQKYGLEGIIIPKENAKEACISRQTKVYPVSDLMEVIHLLEHLDDTTPFSLPLNTQENIGSYHIDFAEVKGQRHVKRGLEIAAAGGHNVLMIGPPGSGKSMLAQRLPTILPDMTFEEALETTKIHSIMGLLKDGQGLMKARPFRSPHHTTSSAAIVGGGSSPRPGEISISHNGVLFLDELPEFNRAVLESLRQPLEDHAVTISRATTSLKFPSKFMLVSAMNPCPCGHFNNPHKTCTCSTTTIAKYLSKISGPLLNRIDIHLDVPAVNSWHLTSEQKEETSDEIRQRASNARDIQKERFKNSTTFCNAFMNNKEVREHCALMQEDKQLLSQAVDQFGLSARSYVKILKVSRTIADLEGKTRIERHHLSEAIQYQTVDRYYKH